MGRAPVPVLALWAGPLLSATGAERPPPQVAIGCFALALDDGTATPVESSASRTKRRTLPHWAVVSSARRTQLVEPSDGRSAGKPRISVSSHPCAGMATSDRPIDRGKRAGRRMIREIGSELRLARVTSGLSQDTAGAACNMSHSEVHRLESGGLKRIDPVKLCCFAEVVGLVPALRLYPDGDAIRDAGHAALLERLRRILNQALVWRTEVPLPLPGDRRAWDATIAGRGWSCPVEAETRLGDGQALARRVALKQRDGGADHVLIVASDTRHNRLVADAVRGALGPAFSTAPSHIRRDLAAGRDPRASALILI
jgi:transcriptional regulator with XRE-family HTH domain